MAKSTRQYVFEGMELLPEALIPFVEKRLESAIKGHWQVEVMEKVSGLRVNGGRVCWDQPALLKSMMAFWKDAFSTVFGHPERSYVSELLEVRNRLSHNETFTYDDAERALDTMRRLMESISAGETADEISKMRDTILRTKYAELQRNEERRKTQRLSISVETVAGLLPWREIVEPHQDVATGEFQQAEFAADLGKVHEGSAPSEYKNPKEFFSRTYLTDGLSSLLVGAAKRLSQAGGDPVVELQTNFGGGKTHSMLALYHMVGGTPAQDLPGLDQLLSKHELKVPGKVNRAVLVGTSRGPQDVLNVDGGRKIRTTWGELAWQLGGAEVYDMIADNDANGIAPGSNLLEAIFKKCAPCADPDRRVGRLSPADLQGRWITLWLVRRQLVFRPVADRSCQGQPRHVARRVPACFTDRSRRRRRPGSAGAPEADLLTRRVPRGDRHLRKRATRSFAVACSRRSPATSTIIRTIRSSSSQSSTARMRTTSRKAAPTRIIAASWRRLIRSIPSCSTSSIRAGDRLRNSSGRAACCVSWRRSSTSCG